MRSRMERYITTDNSKGSTRSSKNEKLYSSLENNAQYTTITDVRNSNAIELTTAKINYRTREGYHQMKEYGGIVETPKVQKALDDFNFLYADRKSKVYDINSVLEEAKKKRSEEEIQKEKRRLINEDFILTKEEIEKYREEKKNETRPDKEKMKELINTITSKTLSGELDQKTSVDLLSDLMATTQMDRIDDFKDENDEDININKDYKNKDNDVLDKEAFQKVQEEKDNYNIEKENTLLKNMDQSFYTRSMDLSDKDFDMDDEFVDKKKVPSIIKIFLVLLLAVLIAVLVYFIIHSF